MLKKFYIIHKNLQQDSNVLYIDGDIVLKKDFTNYFHSLLTKMILFFKMIKDLQNQIR